MNVNRGEVALAFYPFSSGVGGKRRPVLIIQNDRDNHRRADTIVAQITSNLRRAGNPTNLLIEIDTPDGKLSGLLNDSLVLCGNLATIEMDLIERIIGHLPLTTMQNVDICLKDALGL